MTPHILTLSTGFFFFHHDLHAINQVVNNFFCRSLLREITTRSHVKYLGNSIKNQEETNKLDNKEETHMAWMVKI